MCLLSFRIQDRVGQIDDTKKEDSSAPKFTLRMLFTGCLRLASLSGAVGVMSASSKAWARPYTSASRREGGVELGRWVYSSRPFIEGSTVE